MPDLSESFVALIAQAFRSNQVPCVLWGHYLLNTHGVPSVINVSMPSRDFSIGWGLILEKSVDFVIPDDRSEAGIEALAQIERLNPCREPESCPSGSQKQYTPISAFHAHIEDSDATVTIYLQSQTLWFLAKLDSSLVSTQITKLPSYFVLASDKDVLPPWRPGRGSGVFKSDGDQVIIPRSHIMFEAFLRLYARDSGKTAGSFGLAMIGYIEEYVDDDGLLDVSLLPEPLQSSYLELRQGKKPVRIWTKDLKISLGILASSDDSDN